MVVKFCRNRNSVKATCVSVVQYEKFETWTQNFNSLSDSVLICRKVTLGQPSPLYIWRDCLLLSCKAGFKFQT